MVELEIACVPWKIPGEIPPPESQRGKGSKVQLLIMRKDMNRWHFGLVVHERIWSNFAAFDLIYDAAEVEEVVNLWLLPWWQVRAAGSYGGIYDWQDNTGGKVCCFCSYCENLLMWSSQDRNVFLPAISPHPKPPVREVCSVYLSEFFFHPSKFIISIHTKLHLYLISVISNGWAGWWYR